MRVLFWLLGLAAVAVGVSLAMRYNEGFVLLVMPPWRAELSLNLAVILSVAGFVLFYYVCRAIGHMMALPKAVARFRRRRRAEVAAAALHDSLRLFEEGRFARAMRFAEKALDDHTAPGLVALTGWRAACALRDPEQVQRWEARMRGAEGAGYVAARLMQEARFALDERRFDDARSALEQLTAREGRHIAALRLSLRAERGLGNWREVARLARQLEKHRAMTPAQAASVRARAVREALRQLRDDPVGLQRYWSSLDDADRAAPALALEIARALMASGDCREAQRVIETALEENWDASLVLAYAECQGGDVLGRIAQAERWLSREPRDASLLLTLGRLCREQKLWGKARSYFEASLAIAASRAAHVELARLLETLDESAAAVPHYRAAALID